jgi:hypothetical protein
MLWRMHHAAIAHNRGNGVLEDQLLLAVVLKQDRIFVEGTDFPRQLDPADKVNRDGRLILADGIQEGVLYVLRRLVVHVPISRFLGEN